MADTNAIERCDTQLCETKTQAPTFAPAVDLIEVEDGYRLHADVPGATRENLDITCEDGVLSIHACVPPRHDDEPRYVWREYGVGDFHREFRIGEDVDVERIEAEVQDGVLTLHLPKSAAARRRRIEIKGG